MNRIALITVLVWSAITICTSCNKTNNEKSHCPCSEIELNGGNLWEIKWENAEDNFVGIENISFDNYPKVDGSTSANILNTMVACKLLGVSYMWMTLVQEWSLQPACMEIPEEFGRVKNRTYPFIAEVHVAIRSDLDPNSMAYKLYEWLQSENAKYTIAECGFLPK